MKITFVLPVVSMGGGIRVVAIYASALAAVGHKVTLVSPPSQELSFRRKLKSFILGNGWPRALRARSHLDSSGLDHRVLEQWRPVTDEDVPDADVVIATWWETAEWVNALNDRKGAKVYFIQSHEVFPGLPVARVRDTYRLPMHKIVVAKWLATLMQKEYGDSAADLVYNSVDHRQFHAPPRGKQSRPTLGFMYARASLKGVDVALRGIQQLRSRVPALRVVSFGAIRPVGVKNFDDSIEFQLLPPQDNLRELYAQCDVWITASRSEGFNLPAMEAMACRTPVVATRTGWPEEAIETGHNGVLVDIDDAAGLAQGAEWVLSLDDGSWRRLSSNAYATVEFSSWEESARKFESALVHACQRAARGEVAGKCAASGDEAARRAATR